MAEPGWGALAALWPDVPAQRCTRRPRKPFGFAAAADYTDMICAETAKEVEAKRKALLRKRRLRCPAVAASLKEAGDRLFVFSRLPPGRWKSARTTNAIEQIVPPSAETAAMLFWALLASGQITMRKVDGWQTLGEKIAAAASVDLAA